MTDIKTKGWPRRAKLTVYKVFGRSLLHYGAGLFAKWLDRQTERKQKDWQGMLLASHDALLDTLFSTHSKRVLLSSLVRIPLPKTWLDIWGARLSFNAKRLHPDHPILVCRASLLNLVDRNYITNQVVISPLLQTFTRTNPEQQTKRKFTQFLYQHTLNSFLSEPGVLQYYSLIISDYRNPKVDTSLLFNHRLVESKAISWRKNTSGFNKSCCCGDSFSRSHVDTCLPLHLCPQEVGQLWNVYQEGNWNIKLAESQRLNRRKVAETRFCFLDFLLNMKSDFFETVYDLLIY